jgi:GT2 family glycosyltransferase/predicted SAM-dependent methyltransferase/glycosyltransferase involved in cell wall biosynthesis
MKVNLGCGQVYMEGWVNVDEDPTSKADIFLDAFDFVREHGDEVEEVYMGHVLEHMLPGAARSLLALLCDRLPPGALVSAVVPDMRAIFAAYDRGEVSNDDLNARFVYSYVQPSHHLWCHDLDSLTVLFQEAGFHDIEPIDPSEWEPVHWKEGDESRWQVGVRAHAVGASHGQPMADTDPDRAAERAEADTDVAAATGPGGQERPATVEEMLLERVHTLKQALQKEANRTRELQAAAQDAEASALLAYGPEAGPAALLRSGDVRALAKRLLPEGTRRRVLASCVLATRRELLDTKGRLGQLWGRQAQLPTAPLSYRRWSKSHDATDAELGHQVQGWRRTADPLRVAILVASTGDDEPLERTLKAVGRQSWQSWEALVIIPKGSHGDLRPRFTDPRFRWVDSFEADSWDDVNRVVGHTNDPGFLVFLDAGDELAPDCLYQVASHARRDPLVDLVYWDDDLLGPDGSRDDPRFRPAWSPDTLLSANYIGRSFAIRPARFILGGGAQQGRGSARLWEMLLRSRLDETRVSRVTRVLGHLGERGDDVDGQGIEVVNAHLAEQGVPAEAELVDGRVRLRWRLEDQPGGAPRVTVVIPTRHNRPMVGRCLRSLGTTAYPSFDVVVIDNGDATAENEAWYGQFTAGGSDGGGLDVAVHWWTEPFNYSAVNNLGASKASGDVLVFLNDDTEVLDPGWMTELVGWARQPGVGVVGLQLVDDTGALQHAGAILGLGGFADHVFQGMAPGDPSLLGPTTWYRNVLAVTGACLGIDRELFDEMGGFDERFILCGSDVALGLDARLRGRRNLCSPLAGVRHFESVTRGTHVPPEDFFASYWRYQFWIFSGDPYFSPNLSLGSRVPRLRGRNEPSAADRLSVPLGRNFEAFRQKSDSGEAYMLAGTCRAGASDIRAVKALHASNAQPFPVRTVNWFLPDIDSPFYGGINTALRIANKLARDHGVENRFVVIGNGPEGFFRSALAAAFPALAASPIVFTDGSYTSVEAAPPADVSIATLWTTAYAVAMFSGTKRKFYLVQDFEPMFYPAGTLYALAEQSYELGLYALGNTDNMLGLYRDTYGGKGMSFMPAVDPTVFHARTRPDPSPGAPITVFVYARPGHWRNCWELASPALDEVKRRLGDRVRILTAGSWAVPEPEGLPPMRHLGLLDYRATGELYRHCDIGLSLTVSKHPSYLPLELMACGAAVVAFDNSWGHWLLRDGENSLLALQTVNGLAGAIERLVVDEELRLRLAAAGLATIEKSYGNWDAALGGIYPYLCDPEGMSEG